MDDEKYQRFREELENLDTGLVSELYEYLDESNVDRHFMIECILEWAMDNDDVLDDAVEHLEELKKNQAP